MEIMTQNEALNKLVPFSQIMEQEALKQGIYFTSMSSESVLRGGISSGLLSFDLMMGGGHAPGCFSYFFGPSGSCKSTVLYSTFREAVKRGIVVCFFDYESATDPTYLEKLNFQLGDAIGYRNKKGIWEKHPKFWLTPGSTLEGAFKTMHYTMKQLPDKIMLMDKDTPRWFLVTPDQSYTMDWKSVNAGLKAKKIFEVEDGTPQVLFAVDSLAAMISDAEDEDLDKASIAMLARGLHKGFKWVKNLLGRKTCNLMATNHVTINPLAMFRDPETEPGGNAVQFYPDVKIRMEVMRSKKQTVEEENINGGLDRYFNGKIFVKKNKKGPSFRSMEYRLWSDEAGDPGRGICPVFDSYQFLEHTNQLGFTGKEFKILVDGFGEDTHTWDSFKRLMLGSEAGPKLVTACREQLRAGIAQDKYYEYMKNTASLKKESSKSKGKKSKSDDDDTEDTGSGMDVDVSALSV